MGMCVGSTTPCPAVPALFLAPQMVGVGGGAILAAALGVVLWQYAARRDRQSQLAPKARPAWWDTRRKEKADCSAATTTTGGE